MAIFKPTFPQLQRGSRLAQGLIAGYRFCEGSGNVVRDLTRNYDATISGSPVWTGGTLGGGLKFASATSDHAVVSNFPILSPPYTMLCAFRLTTALSSGQEYDLWGKANDKRTIGAIYHSGVKLFSWNGLANPVFSSTPLAAGIHYVGIAVGDVGGTVSLYLNGKFENSLGSAIASDTVADAWLGGESGRAHYANATESTTLIYSRAFDQNDIGLAQVMFGE